MRLFVLAFSLLIGAAWIHADVLQGTAMGGSTQETSAERAEIMKISAVAPGDELASRKAFMEEVHQKILGRDFKWLATREQALRQQGSRTDDGVWKLELYYNAMWFVGRLSPSPDCADPADSFMADWRNASPKSPAPFIVSAQRLLDQGWCFRGSGYAHDVNAGAWQPFHDHVSAAYNMLVRNKAVASVDPQYYTVMASIYVAQGRSDDEFRELLNEAVAKEPYYSPLYDEAFRYYEPQWFGSHKDEEELALFAVGQTQQKDRTSVFARIYWSAMGCGCMPPTAALNRPALRRAMHDLVEIYPTAWNVSHMARLACQIDDSELARSYFSALPTGDDGRSGWADWQGVDIPHWQECRAAAGLSASN
jgi:hypothetical protein